MNFGMFLCVIMTGVLNISGMNEKKCNEITFYVHQWPDVKVANLYAVKNNPGRSAEVFTINGVGEPQELKKLFVSCCDNQVEDKIVALLENKKWVVGLVPAVREFIENAQVAQDDQFAGEGIYKKSLQLFVEERGEEQEQTKDLICTVGQNENSGIGAYNSYTISQDDIKKYLANLEFTKDQIKDNDVSKKQSFWCTHPIFAKFVTFGGLGAAFIALIYIAHKIDRFSEFMNNWIKDYRQS